MRKISAALLLLVATASYAADRHELIDKLVQVSRVEATERELVGALLDHLERAARTDEQKRELAELRDRAAARDTHAAWARAFANLDDRELAELIAFYESPTGRKTLTINMLMIRDAMLLRGAPTEVTAAERERRLSRSTMANMRTLATALEAHATDTNEYPESADMAALQKLLEPVYIRHTPMRDGWGNEFKYVGTPEKTSYRITSGGPSAKDDDDIIYADGKFVRYPKDAVSDPP